MCKITLFHMLISTLCISYVLSIQVFIVPSFEYKTLSQAVANAVDGDVIQVVQNMNCENNNSNNYSNNNNNNNIIGDYNGTIIQGKNLTIIGNNNAITLDCMGKSRAFTIVSSAEIPISVTILGIQFKNGNATTGGALLITGIVGRIVVKNCTFLENISTGTLFDQGGAGLMIHAKSTIPWFTNIQITTCSFFRNNASVSTNVGGALGLYFDNNIVSGIQIDISYALIFQHNFASGISIYFYNNLVENSVMNIGNGIQSFANEIQPLGTFANNCYDCGGTGIDLVFFSNVVNTTLDFGSNGNFS